MGWKSTTYITKEDCIQAILSRLFTAKNETLEDILETLGDEAGTDDYSLFGHNFMIVSSYCKEDNNNWRSE